MRGIEVFFCGNFNISHTHTHIPFVVANRIRAKVNHRHPTDTELRTEKHASTMRSLHVAKKSAWKLCDPSGWECCHPLNLPSSPGTPCSPLSPRSPFRPRLPKREREWANRTICRIAMDCFERKLWGGIYQSDRHLPWCPFRRADPLDLHVKQFVNDVRTFCFALSKNGNIIENEKRRKAFSMNCALAWNSVSS